jgi:hypothetical protein
VRRTGRERAMSTATVRLDQNCRTIIQPVASDSRLTCMETSAPDVYARCGMSEKGRNGIARNDRELKPGESMAVKAGSVLTIRLFRTRQSNEPFFAELVLAPVG